MGWTRTHMAEAKRLYNRKGNRLSWNECIAKAAKGGTRKKAVSRPAAKVAGKKKPAKKTVSVKKRVTVNRQPVNIKIAGTTGAATSELIRVQRNIEAQERQLAGMRGKSMAGMGAAEKSAYRRAVEHIKKYIQDLKRHRTAVKRSIK